MKKIYFIFVILISLLSISNVKAECTADEIKELKNEVNKIKVTYKHLGAVENSEGYTVYDRFNLTFKNVNDDFSISMPEYDYLIKPQDGIASDVFTTGTWDFSINSSKCNVVVDTIKVVLPKFNIYSLDPLCEGIDSDDFTLCDKYYKGDITYEYFEKKVSEYRNIKKIDSNDGTDTEKKNDNLILQYLNDIYNFISNNLLYFIVGLVSVILLLILIILLRRRKKRGVLK